MKILIADDSKLLQDRIVSMVENCDFNVEIKQVFNTIMAKEALLAEKIDIVISDIRMPGGGGLELLQFIKDKFPGIKVIVMTNYPYPQYKDRANTLGAEFFLNKSEELENLVPILSDINSSTINK